MMLEKEYAFSNSVMTSSMLDLAELKKLMNSLGPPPKKMYLVADPFETSPFKPIEIGVPFPRLDEGELRKDRFRTFTQVDFGVKIKPRCAVLWPDMSWDVVPVVYKEPNRSLRAVGLVVAVVLFVLIWSNS